jgi:hypothetical protein
MGLRRLGTESSPTLPWREMDSNFQYAGAVNLVVGPFGWVVPHADDYKALTATATALPIADRVRHPVNFWASARLLSLDGRWSSCTIRHFGGPLWITHAAERVLGGMSGSPVVAETRTAIGVVCTTTSLPSLPTNRRKQRR